MSRTVPTMREPLTFDSNGLKIFGVIHRPKGSSNELRPAVVIYHGFVGSKDQPHRIFVTLAERLAQAGIVSLRIDLPGRGDSEGESIDITVEGDMQAAQKALDVLVAQPGVDPHRLGLVGLSWGGALAASLAGHDDRVTSVVLWSSAPDDLDWKPTFETIDGRDAQDVWGNLVGRQFYDGLHQIKPIHDITTARGPVLIIRGAADEVVSAEAVERAVQVLRSAGIEHETFEISGADHAFMHSSWERELIECTVSWLSRMFRLR